MAKTDLAVSAFRTLEAKERSIVMSFLALSERNSQDVDDKMDELSLSLALKSALKNQAN